MGLSLMHWFMTWWQSVVWFVVGVGLPTWQSRVTTQSFICIATSDFCFPPRAFLTEDARLCPSYTTLVKGKHILSYHRWALKKTYFHLLCDRFFGSRHGIVTSQTSEGGHFIQNNSDSSDSEKVDNALKFYHKILPQDVCWYPPIHPT